MSLEDRHWPSLCIIAVVARSVVVVVVVCADATPVINAVLSNAAAKYFVIIVSSKTVNPINARSVLVPSGERCRPKSLWSGLEQRFLEFGYRTQPSIRVRAAEISRGWDGLLGNQSSLASLNSVNLRSTQPAGPESLEGTI